MCDASYTVTAATAADEGYVLPLAVTVRSAIDSLGEDHRLRLFVLDGGITPVSRDKLEQSWVDPRVTIEWLQPEVEVVRHLPISHHVSIACYLRLLLPELTPDDVGKLVYFDSDMLIRRDLADLYSEPLDDQLALAVQDMAAPWMDSEVVTDDFQQQLPYLSAARPVPNYRELGIRPEAPYFNSGLLVLDASRWRREGIGRQVLQCLEDHREHILWWDQYALNVVLADRWRPLDARWNQTAGVYQYPSWQESPLTEQAYYELRDDPWIVHYCSPSKPWHFHCDHAYRDDFFATLDRTAWRGWRPDEPKITAPAGWRHFRRQFRLSVKAAAASAYERLFKAA
ncbi:MAG: glycosyltransferase family 8 protein [Planctomycetota bacterium]